MTAAKLKGGIKVYVGQSRGREWINLLESHGFGEMVCRGELPARRLPWAFDNGAFKDFMKDKPEGMTVDQWFGLRPPMRATEFNTSRYERDLDWLHLHSTVPPDFLTPPDLVKNGGESLAFSLSWVPRLKKYAPLYLVVQDGMEFHDVEPVLGDFGGLFVGGSLKWKLRTAENWVLLAHAHGKRCHIGRVGTENRVRWARRIGADSIDSCLPLWSHGNLARFLRGFRPTRSRDFFEGREVTL